MSDGYSYFASSGKGLYRCANWRYDNTVPVWEHIGQTMPIAEFALDLNDPDEFQACHKSGTVYVRRPAHYGHDNWVEVYSVADAVTQFGGPPYFGGFGWIEINSAPDKAGHVYIQGHTGLNAQNKQIYLLKSQDYGITWSRSRIKGGIFRATGGVWAGRVTGDIMYATYSGHGLVTNCHVMYSTDEGENWAAKHVHGGSIWVTRVMIDPSNEATVFTGRGVNGPNLGRATSVDGGCSEVKAGAGICIFNGYGGGWISGRSSLCVRTLNDNWLYFSDEGGDVGTWDENQVSDIGHGATFERAMWGEDKKPHWVGVASRTNVSAPFGNYHLLKSTQDNGGEWYDKAGAHASTMDTGGGDSIPYNCGGVSENGLYLVIPGRVFTSVVQLGPLPTGGTVYTDGVQMGPLPTDSKVYAFGVEMENPRS